MSLAFEAVKRGCDVMVVDVGWFTKRFSAVTENVGGFEYSGR